MHSRHRAQGCAIGVLVLAIFNFHPDAATGVERAEELRALIDDGRYAVAADSARGLLAKAGSGTDDDSLRIAGILDVLVESLWRGGKARQAETYDLAQRALAIRERRFGPDHLEVAAALTGLGNVLLARNNHDAARPLLERALKIREQHLGPDDPLLAMTLTPLGNLLRSKADYTAARTLLERALAIREKAFGPDHLDVASSVANLGTLLGDLGDYAGARRAYERALSIREKALRPDHPLVAASCDNLAQVLRVMGDYAGARTASERALAIREKSLAHDDPAIANSLQNLGLALRGLGLYSEAKAHYERAVAIREKALGPEDPEFARAINNLANLLRDMGDYAAARPLYERALAIREKALGPDHPDLANTLDNFALLLENAGDYVTARRFFERALDIRERKYGPEHASVAIALWSLAGLVENEGDHAEARKLYERALGVWERALGPHHSDVAMALNDLAGVMVAMGDYAEARPICERGLKIREAVGLDHPSVAESLEQLAGIFTAGGDLTAARSTLERALAIREHAVVHDDPELAMNLYKLARVRALGGDRAGALDQALQADSIAREHLRTTARGLAEREALRYAAVRPPSLDLALTLAATGIDGTSQQRVLEALVDSRALVLDEMAARHSAITASSDTAVTHGVSDLARARERLASLLVRGVSGAAAAAQRAQIDDARTSMESAERRLAGLSKTFAREQSRILVGLDEVAASLPEGSALVAVTRYQKVDLSAARLELGDAASRNSTNATSYLAFVLRSGERDPTVVDLGGAIAIDERVARWRSNATGAGLLTQIAGDSERASRTSGTALRKAVWDPLTRALGDATRVFVVPDGSLNLVNLAALPAGDGYLIESGPLVHVLSAESDLVPRDGFIPGNGLLAIGSVDYEAASRLASAPKRPVSPAPANSTVSMAGAIVATEVYRGPRADCGDLTAARFESLPATGAETREIIRLWNHAGGNRGEAFELRDQAANESAFKQSAAGRKVLHLATHGFFLGDCGPARSSTRGIGGLDEAQPVKHPRTPAVGHNPLRLSGLVLAGANGRAKATMGEEDGILTSEEIASLDLSGTEWVVLSACETGVGDVHAGEGVFGLRRGFQIAGAGALIMSLWSVDDEATRAWMKALYQARLERGLDTAESVRAASLAVLKQRRNAGQSTHPFYWGAFIGAGDWR